MEYSEIEDERRKIKENFFFEVEKIKKDIILNDGGDLIDIEECIKDLEDNYDLGSISYSYGLKMIGNVFFYDKDKELKKKMKDYIRNYLLCEWDLEDLIINVMER